MFLMVMGCVRLVRLHTTAAIPGTLPVAGRTTYAAAPRSGDPSASIRSVSGREVRWLFVRARVVPVQPDYRRVPQTATDVILSFCSTPSSGVLTERGQYLARF